MRLLPVFLVALLLWMGVSQAPAATAVTLDAASSTKEVDDRIVGKKGEIPTTSIFGVIDEDNGRIFQRNPGLWCADLASYLTCFSPWNSQQHRYQGGTLITPKHALFAEHFSGRSGSNTLQAGAVLVFVGKNNVVYHRTLKATPVRVGNTDLCVGTFKEDDLPPDVIPAQVLPPGLSDRLFPVGTPIIFCDKDKQARIGELLSLNGVAIRTAVAPNRVPWTRQPPAVVGDSASPIFLVVDDRPILLALFQTPVSGLPISANIEAINALLGRGYALDVLKVSKP